MYVCTWWPFVTNEEYTVCIYCRYFSIARVNKEGERLLDGMWRRGWDNQKFSSCRYRTHLNLFSI